MIKIIFSIFVAIHALIHLFGFVKAFEFAEIKELSLPISKGMGVLWLAGFLLFGVMLLMCFSKNTYWWVAAFIGCLVSQFLILNFWQDAKFGTIANLIILIVAFLGYSCWNFEQDYLNHIREGLLRTKNFQKDTITKNDLAHLPLPVQKYLNYVDVVGQAKVKNFKLIFEGEMRGKDQNWFSFTSEQYNFIDQPTRLFFMKAKVKSLPTHGFHHYQNKSAKMLIKLLSTFPIVNVEGDDLFQAETVTFFNDLAIFAPGALIDKNIRWETIDDLSSKAYFSNQGITISATLHFNEKGQLINFKSDDRKDVNEQKTVPFSTPLKNYKNFDGQNLMSFGNAIWHYPEGEFIYGKFNLKAIAYNVE